MNQSQTIVSTDPQAVAEILFRKLEPAWYAMLERTEKRLAEKDPLDGFGANMTTRECAGAMNRSTATFANEAKNRGLKPLRHNTWDKEQFRALVFNPYRKGEEK